MKKFIVNFNKLISKYKLKINKNYQYKFDNYIVIISFHLIDVFIGCIPDCTEIYYLEYLNFGII